MADPAWLAQLKPASFRGVAFQVDSVDWTSGDNLVIREYPFADLPTVFRLGAASNEIRFAAYVIGDDYLTQRDALAAALTGLTEPGILVHPTAGSMRVFVGGKFRMAENPRDEGGMCRFDLVFLRAEVRRYPVAVSNTGDQVKSAAADAKAAAVDQFAARFSIATAPSWVSDRVVGRINSALDATWAKLKTASSGLGDYTNAIIGSYQVLRAGVNTTVSTPRELASQIGQLFTLPTDLPSAASVGFQDAFSGLFNVGSTLPQTDNVQVIGQTAYGLSKLTTTPATAARQQLADLSDAVDQLFDGLATAAYVETLASTELQGYDQALALRQAVHDQCKGMLTRASVAVPGAALSASDWYASVLALMTRSLADLQARSADLARLTTYTPTSWRPVWCISYDLYGTTEWADEILTNNPHITHPLLVPPGQPLRVVQH